MKMKDILMENTFDESVEQMIVETAQSDQWNSYSSEDFYKLLDSLEEKNG